MLGFDFCCMPSGGMPFPLVSEGPDVVGIGEVGPLLAPLKRLLGAVGVLFGRLLYVESGAVSGRCLSVALSCFSDACPTSEALDDAELELYISKGLRPLWLVAAVSRRGGLELRALLRLAASSGPSLEVSRVL